MNRNDFERINEIAKELNEIRLRNNLEELDLKASERSFTHFELHREWNEVNLLTRCARDAQHLRDCKIVSMKQNKETKDIEPMNYESYINYR